MEPVDRNSVKRHHYSMETTYRREEAESFVRRNSDKVAADLPDNEMAQFLAKNQRQEIDLRNREINGMAKDFSHWLATENLESFENEEMQILFKERKELVDTWLKFQIKFPEFSELSPNARGPPTVEVLRATMRITVRDWETERSTGLSKAKENFLGFSETLVSFSNLFSIIPQGDKYISLFTGVLSTATKAAARHKEIAQGFSAALEEIGREMRFSTEELKLYRTRRIELLVIRLYIKHSKFFCHFMTWYSSRSKRFTTSFRNDFFAKEVKLRVTEIRDVVKEIEREASLCAQLSTQRTERLVENLPTMHEFAQISHFYHNQTVQYIDKRLEALADKVGQQSQAYTVDFVENRMYLAEALHARQLAIDPRTMLSSLLHPAKEPDLGIAHPGSQEASTQNYSAPPETVPSSITHSRAGLELACHSLQKYLRGFNSGQDGGGTGASSASTISGLIITRLKEWIASPKSDFLWIIGLNSPYGNEATLATQHIQHLATAASMPFVSFSCNLATVTPYNADEKQNRETALLVAMLYSLIGQLSQVVPDTFEDSYELEGAIRDLDGQMKSIHKAVEIIRVLLQHRTPLLMVILDGLDQLDDDETTPFLSELFGILHANDADTRLKVLIGSQGYLLSAASLEVEERVDCAALPKVRAGGVRPDGRLLSEIDSFPT